MERAAETEGGRGKVPRPRLPAGSPGPDWFRQVTWNSLLASLCPLIPLPFLDDWALGWVRRDAVADALWNEHGHRDELEAAFDRALAAADTARSGAGSRTMPARVVAGEPYAIAPPRSSRGVLE